MKKITIALTLIMMVGLFEQVYAQESVTETTKFAKKFKDNPKKRRFKKLKENYSKAIRDIENIQSKVSNERFGHDKVAKYAYNWIKMMNALDQFPGQTASFKGESISFEIKDYNSIREEARNIACKDHFDEGVEIKDKHANNYFSRKKAITHFNQSLDFGDTYKDQIKELAAAIHYDEGLRIYTNSKSFDSKRKAEAAFISALKWVKPYKDINDLMAELYYNEAEREAKTVRDPEGIRKLMKKDYKKYAELQNIMTRTKKWYDATAKWVPDYEDFKTKYDSLKTNAAEALYEAAEHHELIPNYENQRYAYALYGTTSSYVKDYKDAAAKAIQAQRRGTVYVIVVNRYGKIMSPSLLENLDKSLPSYFEFYRDVDGLFSSMNLNNESNYAKLYDELGKGFIIIKKSPLNNDYDYKTTGPFASEDKIKKYFIYNKNSKETKEVEKSVYNTTKTAQDIAKQDIFNFYTREGTTTTVSYSASLTYKYAVDVWDFREPSNPVLICSVSKSVKATDNIKRQTYKGSSSLKPASLRYDNRSLKTEDELISSLTTPKVNERIYKNEATIAKYLKLLKYKQ